VAAGRLDFGEKIGGIEKGVDVWENEHVLGRPIVHSLSQKIGVEGWR
jgi:hypothetical protein